MSLTPDQLQNIAQQIDQILEHIQQREAANSEVLKEVCEEYKRSARNLIHYSAFRSFDAREMQKGLKQMGFTRLANAEGNILGSLLNLKVIINNLIGNGVKRPQEDHLPIGAGKRLLKEHSGRLFGIHEKERRVRIMVTQPSEAAHDYAMVLGMVKNGMDCARINCAHDDPNVWEAIAKNVRKAAEECSTTVKIAMDLAGPKIRTGDIGSGPKVRKIRPVRNAFGEVVSPAKILLVWDEERNLEPNTVPVPKEWLQKLQVGDILKTKDTRGKSRNLRVEEVSDNEVLLYCSKTIYLQTGAFFKPIREDLSKGLIGELPRVDQAIALRTGDLLMVTADKSIGTLPVFDKEGKLVEPGRVPCLPPSIISSVKQGEPILFDDGKIEGVIGKVHKDFFEVKIVKAKENGSKLKAEKGINFPTLDLGITGLTSKDREDLKYVAKYADIINYSYVNSEEDVELLFEEIQRLKIRDDIGLVLKIETNEAYKNLVSILLKAMKIQHVGVMIARGDLALEVGWNNMGMVQEGILSFCSAAHVPVIWATQVLESLAKNGVPSRSEITDTTSSIKAECVMLNKGPYIHEAIVLLDEILSSMENLRDKKEVMLPRIALS